MNVSAPASAPDLAGLLLQLAAASDLTAPCPGFAPARPPQPGAEAAPSFQAALADLLPSGPADTDDPKAPESKAPETKILITGIAVPVPAPAPEPLPFTFSLSRPEPEPAAAANALPVPAPDAPDAPEKPAPVPQLKNLAFSERFTPIQIAQTDPPLSVPSVRPAGMEEAPAQPAARTMPAPAAPAPAAAAVNPPAPSPVPAAKISQAQQTPATATDAAAVPAAPQTRTGQHGQSMEHRQDGQPRERSTPAATAPDTPDAPQMGHTEAHLETTSPVAPPAVHETSNLAAAGPEPADTRLPDPEPAAAAASSPAPPARPAEAHTVSLRVSDAGEQRVDLKITERQGEVHVAVRAADADLAGSLRENLGELVHKLEQTGLRAEGWQPAPAASASGNPAGRQAEKEFTGGQQSGQQQQQQQHRDGRQGRQQESNRGRWTEAVENSFSSDAERKIWFPA